MAEETGGAVGKLWRKLGKGYYALMAVGTFLYLEVMALVSSVSGADTVQAFVASELVTFAIETLLNTFLATFWPFVWVRAMGTLGGLGWAVGGYFIWAFLLAVVLSRREKAFRKEIGL
jgi:hypothetical protein